MYVPDIPGIKALDQQTVLNLENDYSYRISTDSEEVNGLFDDEYRCFLYHGNCLELLDALPDGSVQLIVTSPPYNIGKSYEQKQTLAEYLDLQRQVIEKCARVLSETGSICWEVGNHIVGPNQILPLDIPLHQIFHDCGLMMRNRIVWHFEHGLHCRRRFSGRYEVISWYSKSDSYSFDLDSVRVPQKYPGKRYFKGPRAGELSGNPLGKNPSDVWVFPNVKHNHREKTIHPCQFPVELVDRLVLSLTQPDDIVLDPFAGVSSALCAAILRNRRACGAEIIPEYVDISEQRIRQAIDGTLPIRPSHMPVYTPGTEKLAQLPPEFAKARTDGNIRNV